MTLAYYILIGAFCVLHSVLALTSVKQKGYKIFSPTHYRLLYNLISLFFLVAIAYAYSQLQQEELFYFKAQNYLGLSLVLLGSYFAFTAFKAYNTLEFLGLADESENQELNTTGMNKYVRHPLYSATLLLLLGLLFLEPTQAFLGLVLILFVYLLIGIKLEEKKLISTFGQNYLDYKLKVPMLIPRFKFW